MYTMQSAPTRQPNENLIKKIGAERFAQLEQLAYIRGYKHDRIMLIELIEKFKK